MKRVLALLLAIVTIFTLCACDGGSDPFDDLQEIHIPAGTATRKTLAAEAGGDVEVDLGDADLSVPGKYEVEFKRKDEIRYVDVYIYGDICYMVSGIPLSGDTVKISVNDITAYKDFAELVSAADSFGNALAIEKVSGDEFSTASGKYTVKFTATDKAGQTQEKEITFDVCKPDPVEFEVVYWETGNGRQWLDTVIMNFNMSQDAYKAVLVSSAENRISEISRGDATGDLYIGSWNSYNAYSDYLYALDDFLATKPDGESGLTVSQKLGAVAEHPDGHVYAIPGPLGAMTALMYNVNLMTDSAGNPYKLPNTTDELAALCQALYEDGTVPFIHYADYWHFIYEVWVAQYQGESIYNKNWDGIYVDGSGKEYANDVRSITESRGRLEAYKVLEALLSPRGYTYSNTNAFTHTTAQTFFLNEMAVMMPNGSWLEKEMGGAKDILPMRTPVISALADKLGILSDKHLSLIVDFVDGTALTESELAIVNGYSAEVIEQVRQARAMIFEGNRNQVVIPSYSNCVDGALALLKYMYSDEGLKTASTVAGVPVGVSYSTDVQASTSWTPFMQACNELSQTANVMTRYIDAPIFYLSGVDHIEINSPVRAMTYRTDGGAMTAEAFWVKEVAAWEEIWPRILAKADQQS